MRILSQRQCAENHSNGDSVCSKRRSFTICSKTFDTRARYEDEIKKTDDIDKRGFRGVFVQGRHYTKCNVVISSSVPALH